MKSMYIAAAAIVVLIIIVGGVFAYTQLSAPTSTPTPSVSPTGSPATSPIVTLSPSTTPQSSVAPTESPISTPVSSTTPTTTSTPTIAPTQTPSPTPAPSLGPASLTGAGATFPYPFLNASIVKYTTQIRPEVQISYNPQGSGFGISALTSNTVDFACSDAAMTLAQKSALTSPIVTIPEAIGAITIAYNLPGVGTGLNLSGPVVANIFMGTITRWNDPAIQSLNPGTILPNQAIATFHRSENSGTTKWFTQYLSVVSSAWNTALGFGQSVQWPVGQGASGNSGVATQVNTTQYSIGYVELAYVLQNGMTIAAVQNAAGNFILPSLASTTAAAASIPSTGLPSGDGDWTGVNILNTSGTQAYPICNPTYVMVYKDLATIPGMTLSKATQMMNFISYLVHDGQQIAQSLLYAPLPANIVQIDETTIHSVTYFGQQIPIS